MDIINTLPKADALVILCTEDELESFTKAAKRFRSARVVTLEGISKLQSQIESADIIVSTLQMNLLSEKILHIIKQILKPGGKIIVSKQADVEKIKFDLTTNGFMSIETCDGNTSAVKPSFQIGSSESIVLPKRCSRTVWKLDEVDDDVETIDPDELLDETDLKKPDPLSLRVCGTTGKRKACKDCSCGLADELTAEAKTGKVIDTTDAPKSSCGSCYLGDAFRCSTCPYMGMPAFKPGEKVQLMGGQLQADL